MPSKNTTVRSEGWSLRPLPISATRRGAAGLGLDPTVRRLLDSGRLELKEAHTARPDARRGAGRNLVLDIDSAPDERLVLAVRHSSGALSFHVPVQAGRRGGAHARITYRFSVTTSTESLATARRGVVSAAVKAFVLKVAGVVADKVLPILAGIWEKASWNRRKLIEGWVAVSREALAKSQPLPAADLRTLGGPPQRNLLLLHGIISHAEAAFRGLASTTGAGGQDFFSAVQPLYGERVFAFNHFTVSRTPEENARMLLESLPARPTVFDCVTHSRGGLVLRQLVERRDRFGALANRFQLGRAVLVASPNQGSPLASPQQFDKLLSWLSNILEVLPDNPFTFGLDLVAEGLAWLAHHVIGVLPGVAAIDPHGEAIAELQAAPNPSSDAYSALVSNFQPDSNLLLRMADVGVDLFFQTANDLVVPTEGGWRVDSASGEFIPGARIGCFGAGGNEATAAGVAVPHTGFFSRRETIDFLSGALRGEPQALQPLDPNQNLPFSLRRAGGKVTALAAAAPPPREIVPPSALAPTAAETRETVFRRLSIPQPGQGETFHLAILPPYPGEQSADLLAIFRNAQVLGKVGKSGGEAGKRWQYIIRMQERIRGCVDGTSEQEMPNTRELQQLGETLFSVILPEEVRRLYDLARAEQRGRRLNVVLTSMIDWMADKPWEFAYDPNRKNFLAVEDSNFVRNVLTAIPAERIQPRSGVLRILVVVAQPLGTAHLSAAEETEVIRAGFHHLIEQGLAEVDVLLDVTPDILHRALEAPGPPIDMLHFIGHGEFVPKNAKDPKSEDMGFLLFENEQGGVQKLDARVLRQIICRRDIRMVFLNSCDSGRGGRADFNRGVAPALMAGGVPVVVANQYSVLDTSATSFARHFYWALAQGQTVGDAAREARVAVNYSISGEAIDWAVPVVYARDPNDVLCLPVKHARMQAVEAMQVTARRSRRAAAPRPHSIGIWDVNRILPHLDQIAATLTACQDRYQVQAVSFSAPLGTWRTEKDSEGTYLRADKIAKRLESKPDELGVEKLICFTNLPLRDEVTLNLFSWNDHPRIVIFSTSGLLEELKPPLLSLERMVANAIAASLGNLPWSQRHNKQCPYFYNQDREIGSIAGKLKLCNVCRPRIKDPALRKAIEAMLAAY